MRSPPQKFGGEIRSVGPDSGFAFAVEDDLREEREILERFEHLAVQLVRQIYVPHVPVRERNSYSVVADVLNRPDDNFRRVGLGTH